jgi:hypothetical protein
VLITVFLVMKISHRLVLQLWRPRFVILVMLALLTTSLILPIWNCHPLRWRHLTS